MPYANPAKQREYQRDWIAKRKAEFFADKWCVRCGATEDLELDHIDRATKVHHAIWSWSRERREAELAKCQVLCGECHLIKTVEEATGHLPYQHGTLSMYHYHGCRCGICKAAKSEEGRAYRARKRQLAQQTC